MKRTVFLKTTLALSLAFSAITSVVAQPSNAIAYPVKTHVAHHENQHGG
jgi:hypothetical protein